MDAQTIRGWIEKRGHEVSADEQGVLRVRWAADDAHEPLPPLFVQCTEHWVVLSVLHVQIAPAYSLVGLPHALLSFNRKIPLAKFAFGDDDDVVLCAELPTESLDEPELADAIDTLRSALEKFGDHGDGQIGEKRPRITSG
jgi:hypothetical protein